MKGKNIFNSIKVTAPRRNVFDLSHDVKMSFRMGLLYPTMAMECAPGDKVKLGVDALIRFAPLVSPVMHRFDVFFHYWFVPNRILWPNWETYITGAQGDPLLMPVHPYITVEGNGSNYTPLMDYMGIPNPGQHDPPNDENINPFAFAAYQSIYHECYRDQNLVPSFDYELVDGDNSANANLTVLRRRAWEHDYFTGALPFAQKGAAVGMPLSLNDIRVSSLTETPGDVGNETVWDNVAGSDIAQSMAVQEESDTIAGPTGKLFIKGEDATGQTTINDLRRASALQRWLEKQARAGSRYFENILVMFGVRSPDARLDRPEYITGTKSPVIVSEVLNTTGEPDGLPQGNMAGHGVSVNQGGYGSYYCQEHGYIICMMSLRPKTAYQNGIAKHFLKINDPYEYLQPDFAHIGEQEVEQRELFAFSDIGDDTFGYVPRYAEYRFMPNRVAGQFRTSLDFWHDGRIFGDTAPLNQEFIECTPSNRIFAVETDIDNLYAHVYHKIRVVRALPKFGTPI